MRLLFTVLAAIALVLFAACGDDDDDGGDDGGASTVGIELLEFSVLANPDSAGAGDVTFEIENAGPDDVHEFVVIKTDLDPAELPTGDDGSVDEEGEGMEVIGEVEDVEVGASESLTVNLEAGSYALICNIFDADENESHYQEGMHTAFTVE